MHNFWKGVYIVLFGALGVLAVTHAQGFSEGAGTMFNGVNGLATTLTGANVKNGTS